MKRCSICMAYKRRHPFYFYRRPRSKDGFRPHCKPCGNAQSIEWGHKNREKCRVSVRASYKRNKHKYIAHEKAYYADHREHYAKLHKTYCENNREIVNDKARRYRARKRNAPKVEKINQEVVYLRDKGICNICSKRVAKKDISLDHVIPLSKDGAHTYQNVVLAHLSCNRSKNNRTVPQQQRLFG